MHRNNNIVIRHSAQPRIPGGFCVRVSFGGWVSTGYVTKASPHTYRDYLNPQKNAIEDTLNIEISNLIKILYMDFKTVLLKHMSLISVNSGYIYKYFQNVFSRPSGHLSCTKWGSQVISLVLHAHYGGAFLYHSTTLKEVT
jgi:hypothetical protein